MPDHPEESWTSWTGRVAADLAALTDGGFATYAAHPVSRADGDRDVPADTRKGWRRRRRQTADRRLPTPGGSAASEPLGSEVLLQARVLEGVLALECIGDTEFEGLSDLTDEQQDRLVALGWEQDGPDPTFSQTFTLEQSRAAAELVGRSLREVLGANRPSQVDTRHS